MQAAILASHPHPKNACPQPLALPRVMVTAQLCSSELKVITSSKASRTQLGGVPSRNKVRHYRAFWGLGGSGVDKHGKFHFETIN